MNQDQPAIPSSLVATIISKKRNTGIYTVGISGGIPKHILFITKPTINDIL
ncbi:MAG: hypothetical protein ACXACW_13640 [Candidatus Hodarchaeales archaeon]